MNPQTIQDHYTHPDIRDTIKRCSREGQLTRWGNYDRSHWYRYIHDKKHPLNMCDDYGFMSSRGRVIYWSLNLFEPAIYHTDYTTVDPVRSPDLSRQHTGAISFGLDIDTVPDDGQEHGLNITDPEVREAIETAAQYYVNRLREHLPNSIYATFSGGGIYVYIHHGVFNKYFDKFYMGKNWNHYARVLTEAVNDYLLSLTADMFKEHPELKQYVKPDVINNAKRLFKCIYSLHKHHDYAVIPLDTDNIKIDFDKATLPLSEEVITHGKTWYTSYDKDHCFLHVLKPYLQEQHHVQTHKQISSNATIPVSDTMIPPESWPPCIRNMLNLSSCGEGRTRALALLAPFLRQVGMPEAEAKQVWYGLADRWGAETSNIFDNYYHRMHTPTCHKLRDPRNIGFPNGSSIKQIGICVPDARCMAVPSPYYYADRKAHSAQLKRRMLR